MGEERHFDIQVHRPAHHYLTTPLKTWLKKKKKKRLPSYLYPIFFFLKLDYVNKRWRPNELKELWITVIAQGITPSGLRCVVFNSNVRQKQLGRRGSSPRAIIITIADSVDQYRGIYIGYGVFLEYYIFIFIL